MFPVRNVTYVPGLYPSAAEPADEADAFAAGTLV